MESGASGKIQETGLENQLLQKPKETQMNEKYFKEQQYTLRLPAILLLYPLFDVLLGIILLSIMITNQNIPGVIAVGVLFIAPMLLTLLLYAIYHITFNADGFSFRSATGKKNDYAYEDIIDIIPGTRFGKIIVKGRNIYVNAKNNQFRYFQEYADKKRGVIREAVLTTNTQFPVMREPNFAMVIYIIGLLLFSLLLYYYLKSGEFSPTDPFSIMTLMISCGLVLLPIIGIISHLNTATHINKDEIIEINSFHKEKHYRFEDLIAITALSDDDLDGLIIKFDSQTITLCFGYHENDIVNIDTSYPGYRDFKRWLKANHADKYMDETAYNELLHPEVPEEKAAKAKAIEAYDQKWEQRRDFCKHNIIHPTYAVSILGIVVMLMSFLIAINFFFIETVDESALVCKKTTFSSGSYHSSFMNQLLFDEYFSLKSDTDDKEYWIVQFRKHGQNQELFYSELDGQTVFYLRATETEDGFSIVECYDEYGNVFFTVDAKNKVLRDIDYHDIYFDLTVILLAFILYFLYLFAVRHMEKLPKALVRLILHFETPTEKLLSKLPKEYYEPPKKKKLW